MSEIESFVRFIGPVSLLLVEIKSFLGFFMLGLLDLANSYWLNMSHFSCFYYFMLGLLDLANSYCETQLKRQCERIIKQGITVDNSAMLLAAAIKYEAAVSIVGSGAYNNGKYLYLSNWFKFIIFTLKKNDMCSVVQKI